MPFPNFVELHICVYFKPVLPNIHLDRSVAIVFASKNKAKEVFLKLYYLWQRTTVPTSARTTGIQGGELQLDGTRARFALGPIGRGEIQVG